MHKLKINRMDFELAFELNSYETTAYLDIETGKVVFVEDYAVNLLDEFVNNEESLVNISLTLQARSDLSETDREQLMDAARVEVDIANRYQMIPKQDSRDGYRDMQEYIESLEDEHLCELLEVAIQGSGAFRRFKDTISRFPEAQANWFKFREEREQQRRLDWFASIGIEPEFE
jgi:hypothetical protein